MLHLRLFPVFLFSFLISLSSLIRSAPALELDIPIDCNPLKDCVIQNFVDTDPGPGVSDYTCGSMGYDGHKGVDFRIRDMNALREGVAVLAAAQGTVRRVRDGIEDGASVDEDTFCGNGVVIGHADGWETIYCHLREGSVSVQPGDIVRAGDKIGLVGLSGRTEFPHVHFGVFNPDGDVVDPFTGIVIDTLSRRNCQQNQRSAQRGQLWSPQAQPFVTPYPSPALVKAGFSGAIADFQDIMDGWAKDTLPARDAPGLVFHVKSVGLKKGDEIHVRIDGPPGFKSSENTSGVLDRPKADYYIYAGRKQPPGGFPSGIYTGRYIIMRDGKRVMSLKRELKL